MSYHLWTEKVTPFKTEPAYRYSVVEDFNFEGGTGTYREVFTGTQEACEDFIKGIGGE